MAGFFSSRNASRNRSRNRDPSEPEPKAPPAAAPSPPEPSAKPEPAPRRSHPQHSRLGNSIRIEGTVTGDEDLEIEGQVRGSVSLGAGRLRIGSEGRVEADVEADVVEVGGRLEGTVRAREALEVRAQGHVEGEVQTRRLAVEDGAALNASVEMPRRSGPVRIVGSGDAAKQAS